MISFEDATTLSLLYHINSEPWLNQEAYQGAAYEVDYKKLGAPGTALALPPVQASPLQKLLHERCSCRRYQPRAMPLDLLSELLSAAYGLTRKAQLTDQMNYLCRSVPSAGGLYPLEIFPLIQRVAGATDGLHHYDVWNHALEPLATGSRFQDFRNALLAFPFVQDANVVFFLTAVFKRTQKKYGPRGYRYILLEAGHCAQNICLSAAQGGLGSLCIGGFFDNQVNRLLELDPAREGVVYAVAAGYPA
jgi:SagB-type dehydrogenase family enzyme